MIFGSAKAWLYLAVECGCALGLEVRVAYHAWRDRNKRLTADALSGLTAQRGAALAAHRRIGGRS